MKKMPNILNREILYVAESRYLIQRRPCCLKNFMIFSAMNVLTQTSEKEAFCSFFWDSSEHWLFQVLHGWGSNGKDLCLISELFIRFHTNDEWTSDEKNQKLVWRNPVTVWELSEWKARAIRRKAAKFKARSLIESRMQKWIAENETRIPSATELHCFTKLLLQRADCSCCHGRQSFLKLFIFPLIIRTLFIENSN